VKSGRKERKPSPAGPHSCPYSPECVETETSEGRIDLTIVTSTLDSSPRTDRGQPYVPLYPTGDNTALFTISSIEGEQNRFFIVNVRGRTVIIDVSAPVKEFDAFLSKAQQPLNTKEGARCSGPRGTLARCSGKQ
jgi:hypothetical protein